MSTALSDWSTAIAAQPDSTRTPPPSNAIAADDDFDGHTPMLSFAVVATITVTPICMGILKPLPITDMED